MTGQQKSDNSGLYDRTITYLEDRREKLLNGGINSIPSPLRRFSDDFIGIEQSKYYVVTSSTKGGKTQFASYMFVYNTLLYAYHHPEQIRIRIFYYPLEETPEDIMIRFMSYLLYNMSGNRIRISTRDLKSSKNDRPISKEILELLQSEEYRNIIQFFEDHITFSSSTNPTGVYQECKRYAEEHGASHYRKQKITGELGETKEVEAFDYYVQDDPDEYKIILFDHVSLISTERNIDTLKKSVDKLSEYCVLLRNRYNFSPVVIQQQAFAGESLDAYKENKLRPTIGNLSDSKYPSRDANVVLGLFSPFKYELRDYMGYDITILRDNIRFLEILVNRGGTPGGIIGLYFDGAVSCFSELPPPNSREINDVYAFLKDRRTESKSFYIRNKEKRKSFLTLLFNRRHE